MFKKIIFLLLVGLAAFSLSAKSAPKVIMTSPDGSSKQYKTIQAALDSIKNSGEFTIKLPKGTYPEVLYYNGPATVILSGESSAKFGKDVVIAKANDGDILAIKKASSAQKNRCLFEFEGTGNLILENLTLHNTFERGSIKGDNTQAESLGFDSTGTVAAYNCSFKSHQDTLRTTGKAWFYNCYVEGDTDFIWMEQSGKVALFEECEIVSVFDKNATNHTSYIGAPRMEISAKAFKGLVIFNSSVSSQSGQATYFGRTPWTSGYYNQIAFVNVKTQGIGSDVWYKTPLLAQGVAQNIIGWKMDKNTAASVGIKIDGRKDILSDDDTLKEFNGRKAILNRYYDISSGKYKKDSEKSWDVEGLASKLKWKVSSDKSKDLLDGEKESVRTTYLLDGSMDLSALKCEGFAQEGSKPHYVGSIGGTISFTVKEKSLVTVTGYYAGSGTIKAGNQGDAVYNLNNGSTSKFNEKVYVVYEPNSTVTITATTKSYITKIVVESDDGLAFNPVTSIDVCAEGNIAELAGRKSVQMKAVLNPINPTNADYVWSVSDDKAATIDENGILVANALEKDKEISVRATSRDAKAAYGEKKIKILKPEAGAFAITWLDSPATSSSLEGKSDDEKLATANKAKPSAGTWKHNSSKITADVAKGSISYSGYGSPIKGKDKVYVDFPITAKENIEIIQLNVAYGNHGTSNMASCITYSIGKAKDQTAVLEDTSRDIRGAKKEYKLATPIAVKKGETINIRVALYGFSGNEIDIPTGKAPTIATVVISGRQK